MTAPRLLVVDTSQYSPASPLFVPPGDQTPMVDEAWCAGPLDTSVAHKAYYRAFGMPLNAKAWNAYLLRTADRIRPDVVLVSKGAYITPDTLRELKHRGVMLVNFATDNPMNDRACPQNLRDGLHLYDLVASPWRNSVGDFRALDVHRVEFVMFAYQKHLHFPVEDTTGTDYGDVAFIGNCDEDRVPWFEVIARCPDIRLRLYGGYWEKHPTLRRFARGYVRGVGYNKVITNTPITLCFARKANGGDHAPRTFEIPACGGFMLAEYTRTHRELFDSSTLFSSQVEMIERIRYWMSHVPTRRAIAEEDFKRITTGHHTYVDRREQILRMVS